MDQIRKPLASPSSTGGSFERELRDLLWRRSRLVFGIGFAVSLISFVVYRVFLGQPAVMDAPIGRYVGVFELGHVALFGAGFGALYLGRSSARGLLLLSFMVIAANLILAAVLDSVFLPGDYLYFAIALLLFVPAAFLPGPAIYQIALAATAVISLPAARVLAYTFMPQVQEFGATGAGTFEAGLMADMTGTTILAVVSVLVSRTLYSLRKTAHRAERLGNYLIERELAHGGMGHVYIARHALMCRPTAIKVLKAEAAEQRTALARFEREVQLSTTLTHPNTITIFDFGRSDDNTFYYAMEYLDGLDLQQLIERYGPIPAERAVYILIQVCGSLAEAHGRTIIHRDMKPSNVFLTHRGGLFDFVKVLDFGLAKEIEADGAAGITQTGTVFGTPRYMAPEVVYGQDGVDARADIYNIGGIAYWMLTGRPPFVSESSVELLIDQVKTAPLRPSEVSELPIPEALEAIVMKCLEKKPGDRYQRSSELQAALRELEFDEPWNQRRAREWWNLHMPPEDSGCYEPEEEVAGHMEAVL